MKVDVCIAEFRQHWGNANSFAKGASVAEARWHAAVAFRQVKSRLAPIKKWGQWLKNEGITTTTASALKRLERMPLEKAILRVPRKGNLYLIQLFPPARVKVGFTLKTVGDRLKGAKTYVPDAVLVSQWACEEHWERMIHKLLEALPSVKRMGTSEVFQVADVAHIKRVIEGFVWELMHAER